VNQQIAHALINAELNRLRELTYSDLTELIGRVETNELVGQDGKRYQLEIQAFWDSKKGGDVRVMVAADDARWRAFKPLTNDFIMRPNGSFVD